MIKRIINFTDYNGVEKREEHYFNITKAEAMKKEIQSKGTYSELMIRLVNTKDILGLLEVFDDLIINSYGKKTQDGRFVKNKEYSEEFISSAAYNELFVELFTDGTKLLDFVQSLFPENMANAQVDKMIESGMYPDEVLEKLKSGELEEPVDNIISIT